MLPLYRLLFNLDMRLTSLTARGLDHLTNTKSPLWIPYKVEYKLSPLDIFEALGGLEYISIFVKIFDIYVRYRKDGYSLEFLYKNSKGRVKKMRMTVEEFDLEPPVSLKGIGTFFMTVGMWSLSPFDKSEFATIMSGAESDRLVENFENCTDMKIRF